MNKVWKKIVAGVLVVAMVVTSIAFDFGDATEAKAAETIDAGSGWQAGDVLADVDFRETDVSKLDDVFVASEGTSDPRTTAVNVSEYWTKNEAAVGEDVNVALGGSVEMSSRNQYLGTADTLVDGNTSTHTGTQDHKDSGNHTESITVTFKNSAYYKVNSVGFVANNNNKGAPIKFTVSVYDGTKWVVVAGEDAYGGAQTWKKDIEPIVCNKIKLEATELRIYDGSAYAILLREFQAFGTPYTNVAIGGTPSFDNPNQYIPVDRINNDVLNDIAVSASHATADETEKATVMFANNGYYQISHVQIFWRGTTGRPEEFEIQAYDGKAWKSVGEKITETDTSTNEWSMSFEPVRCQGVRIVATKLGSADGAYALHLYEFQAWGEKTNYLTTKTTYSASSPTTLLTVKDAKLVDFKAEIEMLYFDSRATFYGLYFGQSELNKVDDAKRVMPYANGSDHGGIYTSGLKAGTAKYIEADAKDYVTAVVFGGNTSGSPYVRSQGSILGFPTSFDTENIQTLNVEVKDGVAKLWWTGYEKAAWTIELGDNYTGGYISLFSRGANKGGFVSFKLQEYYRGNAVDFTTNDVVDLDGMFVASEGTSDPRATAANVSDYWTKNEAAAGEAVNVAIGGNVEMSSRNQYLGTADTLVDGNNSTNTGTQVHTDSGNHTESITVTFKNSAYYKVNSVGFVANNNNKGAPIKFTVSVYDGTKWVVVAGEDAYGGAQTWKKDIEPIVCNKIKLEATELRIYDNSAYAILLREFQAFGTSYTNVALTGTASFDNPTQYAPSERLKNDILNDIAASASHATADETEKATIMFENNGYYEISHVQIFWRGLKGRPEEFEIQAYDGKDWITVGEKITQTDSNTNVWSMSFEPISCQGVRVVATKLRPVDSTTDYGLQMYEFQAWGEKVNYLTTKTTYSASSPTTLLTVKDAKLVNFRAEIEMLYFDSGATRYGLYFGQSEPNKVDDAIQIMPYIGKYTAIGGMYVLGDFQKGTARYVDNHQKDSFEYGASYLYNKLSVDQFPKSYTNNIQTLNVEVIDGIMKAWWTGYESAAWTVGLDDYTGGYISIFSRGTTSAKTDGLVSFKYYEILDKDVQTKANMNIEVQGDYTVVSVANDIAEGILKDSEFQGTVKYDADKYEYCTTVITDSEADVHQNVDATASNGTVAVNFQSYNKAAVAKLYFKNMADTIDYSGFAMVNDSVERTSGKTADATTTVAIAYDYTGENGNPDKCVDVRDLVHSAKEGKTPENVRKAMVGVGSEWTSAVVKADKSEVYVDATNGTLSGAGTAESPLNSLQMAAYRVADGGTIYVVGTYAFDSEEKTIGMGGKTITIKGKDSNAKLDLTGITALDTNGNITIDNIKLAVGTKTLNIYANGHDFTINSNVTFDGYVKEIYAGNLGEKPLATTNMKLYGGAYGLIYAGSHSASVITDETNLIIGGNVNRKIGFTVIDDKHTNMEIVAAYGGSRNGIVKGDTNITIQDNALLACVNGGGNGSASVVSGTCNLYVKGGETIGCHGGSLDGTVNNTNLVMTGGTTEQLFGGSWESNNYMQQSAGYTVVVKGNTTVTFTGGTVTRRIFGGSYTDADKDYSYVNSGKYNLVNGTSTLNIGGDANYSHNYGGMLSGWYDLTICAGSRFSTDGDEISVINITTDRNNKFGSYIDNGNYGTTKHVNVVDTLPQ